jgi:hypothetical protein
MKNSNIGAVTGDAIIALSTGKMQRAKGLSVGEERLLRGH